MSGQSAVDNFHVNRDLILDSLITLKGFKVPIKNSLPPARNPQSAGQIVGVRSPTGVSLYFNDGEVWLLVVSSVSNMSGLPNVLTINPLSGGNDIVMNLTSQIQGDPLSVAGAPAYSFSGDLDTGVFWPGANMVALSTGGTVRLTANSVGTGQVQVGVAGGGGGEQLLIADGTLALPGLSFTSDPNTGVFWPGADTVATSAGGVQSLTVTTGAVNVGTVAGSPHVLATPDGTGALPSHTFIGDPDTGIFSSAADILGISAGGTSLLTADGNAPLNVTVGAGVKLNVDIAGGDAIAGTATLVGGTVTVATTSVTAASVILVTRNVTGGTAGNLSVGDTAITPATDFTIDSDDAMETSTVNWFILN